VRNAGFPLRRRSQPGGAPLRPGDVLVLDTVGELAALYGRARLAFVGGSLVPVGGHNVLEPAAAGCPVCYGPHTGGIRHAVEVLERCDAGREVADAAALADEILEVLHAPDVARARGARGQAALDAARGAADRSVALVARELARPRDKA
jgi:3-deoxy-D-manno-octulosonic-acid transferase